ncbi:MAG: hypothetical protein IJD92_04590 [Bacilli bacterium]|nr:hypothetical protein [Bacilli bacterium]
MPKKIIYHYKRNGDNKDCILEVPYYETIQKINGNDFRKIFILDIRYLKHREEIFRNFDNFQTQLLADEFFSLPKDTEYPMTFSLYFLNYNNKIVNCEEILYDYHFALKDFISIDEYNKILRKELNLIVVNSNSSYNYNGKTIQTNNFNLIYGLNGSGKTRFLKDMASKKNIPLFYLNKKFEEKNILLSNSFQYLENLSKIIDYCQTQNIPLLLDDLCWYSFDWRNQIKVIDTLYDYSHNNDVFFTSAQYEIKRLVKKRSHKPNIIEFDI